MIITHSGIFHADEVFAIAALIKWNLDTGTFILRTRKQEYIFPEENTFIVDVGGVHDESKKMFDHHQNLGLPASNLLVYKYIFSRMLIPYNVYVEMHPFMKGISNYDINKDETIQNWSKYNKDHQFRNISNIIAGFNRDPLDDETQLVQFRKAISFAIEVLDNEEHAAIKRIEAEDIYDNRTIIGNNIALFDRFCPIWKEKKEHIYAILPNPGGWSLNTADSSQYPLPIIEHEDLTFAHKGRFIMIFSNKEAAIEVAMSL